MQMSIVNSGEKVTAWVTKYALTAGIREVEGEVVSFSSGSTMLTYTYHGVRYNAHNNDFCMTEEEAKAKAEEMRASKLKSLDKQIKKISALKF